MSNESSHNERNLSDAVSTEPIEIPSDNSPPNTPISRASLSPPPVTEKSATPTPEPPVFAPRPNDFEAGPSNGRRPLRPRGANFKRTARMRVHLPTPSLHELEHFAWVQRALELWREEEGMKRILDARPLPVGVQRLPITREPVERTIPPLVVRVHRHERILRALEARLDRFEGHFFGRAEPLLAATHSEAKHNVNRTDIAMARIELLETENAYLKEDREELVEAVAAVENVNKILDRQVMDLSCRLEEMEKRFFQGPPPPPMA